MGTCGSFFTLLQLFVSAIMMASVLFFCYYANPNSLIFFVISSYGHSTVLDHSFWVIWLGLSFPILALFFLFILKQGVFFRLFRPVFMTGLQSFFSKQCLHEHLTVLAIALFLSFAFPFNFFILISISCESCP